VVIIQPNDDGWKIIQWIIETTILRIRVIRTNNGNANANGNGNANDVIIIPRRITIIILITKIIIILRSKQIHALIIIKKLQQSTLLKGK